MSPIVSYGRQKVLKKTAQSEPFMLASFASFILSKHNIYIYICWNVYESNHSAIKNMLRKWFFAEIVKVARQILRLIFHAVGDGFQVVDDLIRFRNLFPHKLKCSIYFVYIERSLRLINLLF